MKPFTQNGYLLFEVISALQKDIRRGNEEAAMYWALELVPKYEAYLWRRLIVILNEDIGIANIQLLAVVPVQRAMYTEFREDGRDGSARLVLANVILAMCRSPKSRAADHFQCVINQGRLQGKLKLEIPDYALDKHTSRGRGMGRGVQHWRDEGCQLSPTSDVADPYAGQAFDYWGSDSFVDTAWPKRGRKFVKQADAEVEDEAAQLGLL